MRQNLAANPCSPLIAGFAIGLALFFCGGLQLCLANLFVADSNGRIGEYTDSGKVVNRRINPQDGPSWVGLTASGTDVFALEGLFGTNSIGKYSTSTGIFNPLLISVPGDPGFTIVSSFAASGSSLFVLTEHLDAGSGTISQYDASGKLVNPSLITALGDTFQHRARALVASGDRLYVSFVDGTIGEYTTSGETINARLITGVAPGSIPIDLAVSDDGSRLFVSNFDSGTISEYTTSGEVVDSALISGLSRPSTLDVSGSRLFVGILTSVGGDDPPPAGQIAEYTTSGQLVNPLLIPNLPPLDLAITDGTQNIPETLSTWWFAATAAGILFFARLRPAPR
jgi:hypothetical protein